MENTSFDDVKVALPGQARFGEDVVSSSRSSLQSVGGTRNLIRGIVRRVRRNSVRELYDWARCKRLTLPSVMQMRASIAAFDNSGRAFEEGDAEAPIFLLATGWRSGSTLLQRVLVSDPDVLVWGEPLGEMAFVSGISQMLTRLSAFPGQEAPCSAGDPVFSSLATSWIATLSPPGVDFRAGLQALLTNWLGHPARQRGFHRWGFKEVRLGGTEATLLHWLYPKAKFVLLSRNPYDCYRSLSDSGWHHVYHSRPAVRVDSAAGLARHWNRIAMSWSELPADFPAVRIKYEDVISGRVDFRQLGSWLGVQLKEDVALSAFVGSTTRRQGLSLGERWIISHEAAAGMVSLGYSERVGK